MNNTIDSKNSAFYLASIGSFIFGQCWALFILMTSPFWVFRLNLVIWVIIAYLILIWYATIFNKNREVENK